MPSSRRIMFGDESIARECFKCIYKWKKVLFTVENYWEQAWPSFRDFKSRGNVSCDKYFHQNKPHKSNWKHFQTSMFVPASPKTPEIQSSSSLSWALVCQVKRSS